MYEINGILNILKPTGMTSHDVVGAVRKILGIRKVGHAGTLDPNVAGVLVVCVGKGTKLSDWLMNGDKEYICELILGSETDTQDSYGNVTATGDADKPDIERLLQVVKQFEGEYMQVPPAYSAVKLNGRKLYEYARENIVVEKAAKPVIIKELKLIKYESGRALMRVRCSKGTYMRTLCSDIGKALGTLGHMGVLVRTEAKGLKIDDSVTLSELKYKFVHNCMPECLLPVDSVYPLDRVEADDSLYDKLLTGNEVSAAKNLPDGEFYIYCRKKLLGMGSRTLSGNFKIDKMLI